MDETVSRRALLQMLGAVPLAARVPSVAAASDVQAPTGRVQVGLVSRHVQWTSADEAIAISAEAGFDAIEWNVRTGGHVAPDRVEQDLPRIVAMTRKAGLSVTMITTSIQDAQSPHAEAILRTASGLGIRYYRGGEYFRYDYSRDLSPQLDALKSRLGGLAELGRKYQMTWAYHTHSAPGVIGGNVWDIMTVLDAFDPAVVALNFDTGHTVARAGGGWIDVANLARRYIACLAVKDFRWLRTPEGRWRTEFVPIGEGMVDFKVVCTFLKGIGFAGPINIHYEHNGLLGTDVGKWKLEMERERFLSLVRADLQALRDRLKAAGFSA